LTRRAGAANGGAEELRARPDRAVRSNAGNGSDRGRGGDPRIHAGILARKWHRWASEGSGSEAGAVGYPPSRFFISVDSKGS
jgi:hypothetical protein